MKRNIAVFASGNGTNFEALANACEQGIIEGRIALCVTDCPSAYVIKRAEKHSVPVLALNPKDFPSKKEYEKAILERLEAEKVEIIFLAGYMRLIGQVLLTSFRNRIINIHPSLLPAFPGLDAIGQALEYGVKVYGVTIHFVDETLDGGKIISQGSIHYDGSDREELEPRIHELEHKLYVETASRLVKELPNRV